MVTELASPAVRELPGPRRGPDDQIPDDQSADPLRAIADVPAAEQDRLLWQHGEAVADHMANNFARRAPHLAARGGFAPWQRAAGAAAALGAVALLVIVP